MQMGGFDPEMGLVFFFLQIAPGQGGGGKTDKMVPNHTREVEKLEYVVRSVIASQTMHAHGHYFEFQRSIYQESVDAF